MFPKDTGLSSNSISKTPSLVLSSVDPPTSPLTSLLLKKRRRSTAPDTHPLLPPPPPTPKSRVAIQQEDPALDAIVVTTLSSYPFRCHEDLLRMSREELISVACALNKRLPASWQIPVGNEIPDAAVRSSIEVLVGIRPSVPMAPRAVKPGQTVTALEALADSSDAQLDDRAGGKGGAVIYYGRKGYGSVTPPSSPLSLRMERRSQAGGAASPASAEQTAGDALIMGCISPRRFLDRLDEEEEPGSEEGDGHHGQHQLEGDGLGIDPFDARNTKKRKVSGDGRYKGVWAGKRGSPKFRSAQRSSGTTTIEQISVAMAALVTTPHKPSGNKYRFSVPRKPVKRSFLESERTGGEDSDLHASPATLFFR